MKNCPKSHCAQNHKTDCIIIRQRKRSQSSCGNSHSEKSKTKIAAQNPIIACRWTTCSYGSPTVQLDSRAGNHSCPPSLGGLSNARLVGKWARVNYGQRCNARRCCSLAAALHSEAPEQLECNWHRGPVVQSLEASRKKRKQAISIRHSPDGVPGFSWLLAYLASPFAFRSGHSFCCPGNNEKIQDVVCGFNPQPGHTKNCQ